MHAHDGHVEVAERRMADGDELQLAAFRVATDEDVHADHWEMHPTADEVVCCLRGALRLHLRGLDGNSEATVPLESGDALVVPRGRWHRLSLDEPSEVMTLTRRGGTQLERCTT